MAYSIYMIIGLIHVQIVPLQDYYMIREYLLPGWLLFVQICITLAFIITFLALGLLALELIRWPLKIVLQYEWLMTRIACFALGVASKSQKKFIDFRKN